MYGYKILGTTAKHTGLSVPAAFERTSKLEGLIPALETSHALAYLEDLCPTLADGTNVVLNFSGRGDKDVQTAIKLLGDRVKGGLSTPGH